MFCFFFVFLFSYLLLCFHIWSEISFFSLIGINVRGGGGERVRRCKEDPLGVVTSVSNQTLSSPDV